MASASSTEYGHGSSQREGASTTAARARSAASSLAPSRPVKRTSAPAARPFRRTSSGPSPAITSGTPAVRAAAIAVSKPFSSVSRPAASANSPDPARDSAAKASLGMKLGNVAVNEAGSPKSRRWAAVESLTATN